VKIYATLTLITSSGPHHENMVDNIRKNWLHCKIKQWGYDCPSYCYGGCDYKWIVCVNHIKHQKRHIYLRSPLLVISVRVAYIFTFWLIQKQFVAGLWTNIDSFSYCRRGMTICSSVALYLSHQCTILLLEELTTLQNKAVRIRLPKLLLWWVRL
jgi:hypothetical protein